MDRPIERALQQLARQLRRTADRLTSRRVATQTSAPSTLRHPVMLIAFEGWNDAGDAASHAANFLARAWAAEPLAEIDPDEFFDFTEVRPESSIAEDGRRRILWPSTTFSLVPGLLGGSDVVIVRGPEPQLRWRTYCEAVIELARGLGIEKVVTLGAYLGEVTHRRPTPVSASAADPAVARQYHLEVSRYEGPTGIVGVLTAALAEAGIPAVSVWANVPCYSLPLSPKAALALVRVVLALIEREVDLADLEEDARTYEERMEELIAEDESIGAYVTRIEEIERSADPEISVDGLTEEIERYLRNNRSN